MRAWLLLPLLLLISMAAHAADPCPQLAQQTPSDVATRIAAVACREHLMWYRPFIDREGRLANAPMMEAESSLLSIGEDRAWQRVARYWRDSGLLGAIGHRRGATDCLYASATGPQAEACRGFVVDTPWSAAFISWVMREARVPGFRGSSRHFRYVQAAYQDPSTNAFEVIDVARAKPAVGDLICYVRQYGRLFGHEGLLPLLRNGTGLDMHCDIVVAVNPGNDSTAYAIGGNVQQAVTMRMLPLNRNGEFWGGLPLRIGDLICYVRQYGRLFGHEGLLPLLRNGTGLDMHCDIVVAVNPGNDSTAYAIGGNVQQAVTMRMLPLNRNGEFWGGLPLRIGDGTLCAPDNAAACNMNRQDWAAILRLKSPAELAKLPGYLPPAQDAPEASPEKQECCVNCVVGSGVPRCPAAGPQATEPAANP